MGKPRSAPRILAEWLAALAIERTIRTLPARLLVQVTSPAAGLARLLWVSRRRNAEALVATRLGHPAGSAESRRIVAGSLRTLLLNLVEPVALQRLLARGQPLDSLLRVEGAEHLDRALASGRGVIVASAHIGAWESLSIVLHQLGKPSWGVWRTSRNPRIDRLLVERRLRWMRGHLPKRGCAQRMKCLLRSGEWLALPLDQAAGRHGVRLDFLGAPASHHMVAGVMSMSARALVLPVYLLREPEPLHFRLVVEPALEARAGRAAVLSPLELTRRLSHSLERQVLAHPDQWLWVQDRWRGAAKAREPGVRPPAAADSPAPASPVLAAERR